MSLYYQTTMPNGHSPSSTNFCFVSNSYFYGYQLFSVNAPIYTGTLISYFFSKEIMENKTLNVGYSSKTADIFITVLNDGPVCPKTERYKIHLIFLVLGIYYFGQR